MAQAFAELSVAQIQAGLTAKEFSAKEVAENSLARIVSADKAVHAFLETTEEAALAAADGGVHSEIRGHLAVIGEDQEVRPGN